ncbi:MAG: hypothetical protein ACJ75B_21025 [Flavisolibacter sp.]
MPIEFSKHPSSYRDPSGFLFYYNGILYRQVNLVFKNDFDLFISGGLYQKLVEKNMLIAHQTLRENLTGSPDCYATLQPEFIPFISYPYEWCFDMLRDAALVTLEAAREALKFGMMLKDASAYNIQWQNGKMKFIDSLSFEIYKEEEPWIAYRQFCQHFFAPLALMHYLKKPMQELLLAYPEGIPLDLASQLLPFKSRFNIHAYLHLHLQKSVAMENNRKKQQAFSKQKMLNLLRSLEEGIRGFSLKHPSGPWSGYYEEACQREGYLEEKKNIIEGWTSKLSFDSALDLGANEGAFSELISLPGRRIISVDLDHYSINRLYQKTKTKNNSRLLPLVLDISKPSPAIGANNEERSSFFDRCQVDLVMALAVLHHLAIGKNMSFAIIAETFRRLGKNLIVEFIPKEDEKVQNMISQKKDVYGWYTKENFLSIFSSVFNVMEEKEISGSKRILYLMQRHER